jgi:hypothetical protein
MARSRRAKKALDAAAKPTLLIRRRRGIDIAVPLSSLRLGIPGLAADLGDHQRPSQARLLRE